MDRFRKNKSDENDEEVRYKIVYSDNDTVKLLNPRNGQNKYLTIGDSKEESALESYNFNFIARGNPDGRTNKERYTDSYNDFARNFKVGEKVAIYSTNDSNNGDNGVYRIIKNDNELQKATVERESDGKLMTLEKDTLIASNYYSFTKPTDRDYLNYKIATNGINEPLPYPID